MATSGQGDDVSLKGEKSSVLHPISLSSFTTTEIEALKLVVSLIGSLIEGKPENLFVPQRFRLLEHKERLDYLTTRVEETVKWLITENFSQISEEKSYSSGGEFSGSSEIEENIDSAEEMAKELAKESSQPGGLSRESLISLRHLELMKSETFFAKTVPCTLPNDWPCEGEWRKYVSKTGYLKLKYIPTVHSSLQKVDFPSKKMTVLEFPDDGLEEVEILKSFCDAVDSHENVWRFLFMKRTPKEIVECVKLLGHVFFYFEQEGDNFIEYVNTHNYVTSYMFQNMISQAVAGFIHLHTCGQCKYLIFNLSNLMARRVNLEWVLFIS